MLILYLATIVKCFVGTKFIVFTGTISCLCSGYVFVAAFKTTAKGKETADEEVTKTALSASKYSNEKWAINWSIFSAIESSTI